MTQAIDYIFYHDGNWEILEDENPTVSQAERTKHRTAVALTQREYEEYMSLRWLERTLYIREKAMDIINKK